MAVTPILQSISAFDVTKQKYKEIIDESVVYYCAIVYFNATGSTEFIRSNKLTIYDSTTGEIVATHIYNSTSFINKIPTNLTGISNGNYYYATIELFDQIDAGGNSLGLSSAKQFWCLSSPTIVVTRPESNIQNYGYSSYNFVAEFTMYTDGSEELNLGVSNKIQSYQFDLYKGSYSAATLEASSGLIFNTGSTIDDNTYIINYIFNNLQTDATYFVKINITTEQGMTDEVISHTVGIATESLTFSVAQVTNKSCDGYIEVQSNITNISGYTNANYTVGDGYIDLTKTGDYVLWGYDPETGERDDTITFPYIISGDDVQSRWSFLIAGKDFTPSINSPIIPNDESYILRLRDYNDINGGYLYYRNDGTNVWLEFYVYQIDNINDNMTFVQSNQLLASDITSDTMLYILLRCNDGWYDVTLSDSL